MATLPELRAVEDFKLAVVGLRLRSEHEDDCCATVELTGGAASKAREVERHQVSENGISWGGTASSRILPGHWPQIRVL